MTLIYLIFLMNACLCIEFPKEWVDYNDMRNYDRNTKTMKSSYTGTNTASCDVCDNFKHSGSDVQEENQRLEIFIERFINRILQSANLKDRVMKPGTKIVTEIPISITAEELNSLTTMGHGFKSCDLHELDRLLSLVLSYERGFTFDTLVSYLNPVQELFFNLSIEKAVIMVGLSVSGVTIWMFAVGQSFRKIMLFLYLLCFLGGMAFNAWYMYMEAVSEQVAESQRFMLIPDVCNPKKVSWWSYLFSTKSECVEFQKTLRIDPLSKVTPSIVFSHTLSMMFTHPLKELGARCGDFLVGVSNAAPWPLNYLFLPIVLIVFCLLLLFVFMAQLGASFNCWTLLGGLSIKCNEAKENKTQAALMNEIKDIKRIIKYKIEETHRMDCGDTQGITYCKVESFGRNSVNDVNSLNRPDAGDNQTLTYRKIQNVASNSSNDADPSNDQLMLEKSNDATNRLLNCFNVYKVNRKKAFFTRNVNPKSVTIKKKLK